MKITTLKAISLSISTLVFSPLAIATCAPPPPPLQFYSGNLPGIERVLSIIPPLTSAAIDYYCPFPIGNTFELRKAYSYANPLPQAIVHALSDQQMAAIGLTTDASTVSQAPLWDSATIYQQGQIVQWQNVEYSAQWWSQGETPGTANSAWRKNPTNSIAAWDAGQIYEAGSKTIYQGRVWQARWWTQNEVPANHEWGAWQATTDSLPSHGASRFSARLDLGSYSGTSQLAINVRATYPNSPTPAYIEVRENGVAIGRLTQFMQLAADCFDRNDSSCNPGIYWTSVGSIPVNDAGSQLVYGNATKLYGLWACTSNHQCRPSQLTAFSRGDGDNRVSTIHPSEPFPLRD
ncbi:carbohydrate-binding protein [Chitinibacter tainanensis]|uniref:carbohydrate-binding protein n=1 Tax=Chitinibacter tainanensis TaxID=230667 RepID=UPI0023568B8D|nr:carbohydrate-binding protein [Chitinibacter tainanensis]